MYRNVIFKGHCHGRDDPELVFREYFQECHKLWGKTQEFLWIIRLRTHIAGVLRPKSATDASSTVTGKCGASSVYPWLLQAFPEFTTPLHTYLYPMQSIRTGWFVLRTDKVFMKTCCHPRFCAESNFESKFAALYFRNRICGLKTLFSCHRKKEFICFQSNTEINSQNKT